MQLFDWNKWIQLILRLCFHGHTIAVTALVIKQIKKNKRQSCMYWKGNWNLSSERHRYAGMLSAQVDSPWPPAFILHRNYWARACFSKGEYGKNRTRKIWPTPTPQIPARVQTTHSREVTRTQPPFCHGAKARQSSRATRSQVRARKSKSNPTKI